MVPEFWSNRLAATDPPLDIAQTRIPEIPDQTEFLQRWFEFHQGYRIIKLGDDREQRIAVIGEPFKEVSPGFLPRTLDQLRAGVANDARRPENRLRRRPLSSEETVSAEPQQSLEDALDSLLSEVTEDEAVTAQQRNAQPTTEPFERDTVDAADPVHPLTRREAQLQRARERFARVFGTREDLQQEDYVSPLATMYGRADDRYQQAEQLRAEGITTAPSTDGLSARERRIIEEQLLWGVMRESQAISESLEREGDVWSYEPVPADIESSNSTETSQSEVPVDSAFALLAGQDNITTATLAEAHFPENEGSGTTLFDVIRGSGGLRTALPLNRHFHLPPELPSLSLDNQPDRPPPQTDEAMTRVLACQVCYQQLANIAVLPCGHMVMCEWCADVVIPVRHSHLPVRRSNCPMCRKQVKQRFKIHM